WCIAEEYREALAPEQVARLAAVIREADDHDHIIAVHHQSDDRTMDFPDDPNIDQFALQSKARTAQELHEDVAAAVAHARGRFHVVMAENWNERRADHVRAILDGDRAEVRRRNWAAATAGGHVM